MKGFHFNYKDLFRAGRIAFSLQRIWVNGLGLLVGYLFYLVFTYAALLIGGVSFSQVWYEFGLFPCAFAVNVPWYSLLVYLVGLLLFIAVILLTNTAVARTVYMVLREELFYTWTQAYKFAWKKWVSVLGAMITFIFMIAFFVIGAIIMGLLGKIPYVGELGTALLTIPYIFSALLLLFISVVFVVGIFFIPAIIATSDEDALGGVFQSFSITFNQPWRLIVYSAIVGILEFVGIFLFAAVLKLSYKIFLSLFTIGMGDKLLKINDYSLHLIDKSMPPLYNLFHGVLGDFGNWVYLVHHHFSAGPLPGTYVVSAYIFAFFLLLLGGAAIAYGEAIGNAGVTIIYVILYKLHEDENLLEREDDELKEDEEAESASDSETESEERDSDETEAENESEE